MVYYHKRAAKATGKLLQVTAFFDDRAIRHQNPSVGDTLGIADTVRETGTFGDQATWGGGKALPFRHLHRY